MYIYTYFTFSTRLHRPAGHVPWAAWRTARLPGYPVIHVQTGKRVQPHPHRLMHVCHDRPAAMPPRPLRTTLRQCRTGPGLTCRSFRLAAVMHLLVSAWRMVSCIRLIISHFTVSLLCSLCTYLLWPIVTAVIRFLVTTLVPFPISSAHGFRSSLHDTVTAQTS